MNAAERKALRARPSRLAEQLEERRESKKVARIRREHPELDVQALTTAERAQILELQEQQAEEWQELAESIASAHGVLGGGYTLQVSEGVLVRPKKEQAAAPRRRKK